MTDSLNDCRKAFEKWIDPRLGGYPLARNGDTYRDVAYVRASDQWEIWQAAWEAKHTTPDPSLLDSMLAKLEADKLQHTSRGSGKRRLYNTIINSLRELKPSEISSALLTPEQVMKPTGNDTYEECQHCREPIADPEHGGCAPVQPDEARPIDFNLPCKDKCGATPERPRHSIYCPSGPHIPAPHGVELMPNRYPQLPTYTRITDSPAYKAGYEAALLKRESIAPDRSVDTNKLIAEVESHFRPLYNAGAMNAGELHMVRRVIAVVVEQHVITRRG